MSGESAGSNPPPVAAAITPRNPREEIDFGAGFELIDYLCRAGIGGIALFTAIGEYASLAGEERARFLCLAVKRSRKPVYAGIGAATLEASLALARQARDAGAAALLLPPPYGFIYGQDDIREFYLEFAAHAGGGPPAYLINSPGLSSQLEEDTAAQLIAGGGFAGSSGFVSDIACAVPELLVARHRAVLAGKAEETVRIDAMLREFTGWTREFPAPVALKVAVSLRGIRTGPLPAPLTPHKQERLRQFRAWFAEWLPRARKVQSDV